MKINAVIESKDGGTLVLDFPRSIYDVYEKLQSVGIRQSPHQVTLSDEDGDDVRVKLYSDDEIGKHLLLTLNERNSLADANMTTPRTPSAIIWSATRTALLRRRICPTADILSSRSRGGKAASCSSLSTCSSARTAKPIAIQGNLEKAKRYTEYALKCGTAPVVPHFYALCLNDDIPIEREIGLSAGMSLLWFCDELWIFGDEITEGMRREIDFCKNLNIKTRAVKDSDIKKVLGG